jgi:hypothetical protein
VPVPQPLRRLVDLPLLQSHNLLDVLDLGVVDKLRSRSLSDVEKLSSQREDTEVISTDDVQTGNGESLGRVSFRQDEGAVLALLRSGVVGVFELEDTGDPAWRKERGG